MLVTRELVLFSLGYFLLSLGLIFPPNEFYGFGLTIEHIFSSLLGDEGLHFIRYHIRLTSARIVIHSFIPLVYYIIAAAYFSAFEVSIKVAFVLSLPCFTSALTVLKWWRRGDWSDHPLARTLRGHIRDPAEWIAVGNTISTEFRRYDKFVYGKTWGKVVVTDNWILRCGLYRMDVAYQPDVHLNILTTSTLKDTSHRTTEFVQINVSSVNTACRDFVIRLNVMDYADLTAKLQAPILNVRNIVFQQSLSDRFEAAFREEVLRNGRYEVPSQVEECIGCLYAPADVKLSKLCDDRDQGDCRNCLCRPMWCLRCLVKWFANRQNANTPERWLGGKAPCPTCRSTFCPRDVQMVETMG